MPILFLSPILLPPRISKKDFSCLLRNITSSNSGDQVLAKSTTNNYGRIEVSARYSRRCFLAFSLISSISINGSQTSLAHTSRPRTVLDEEIDLSRRLRREAEEARMEALRAAFDAVEKASKQLDEVEEFLNEKDWNGIHGFTRLFNNAVEREGMEPIARRLGKKEKAESLQVCSQLTQALKEMDRNATREDEEGILRNLQSARDIIASFQKFKP